MTGRIWDLADKVEEGVPTMGHVRVKAPHSSQAK